MRMTVRVVPSALSVMGDTVRVALVVTWWAIPYEPADSVASADIDDEVPVASTGPGASSTDSRQAVGILPFPTDRSPAALTVRLLSPHS